MLMILMRGRIPIEFVGSPVPRRQMLLRSERCKIDYPPHWLVASTKCKLFLRLTVEGAADARRPSGLSGDE